jgi:hypothetical protein
LRSGTVGPELQKLSRVLRGLQRNHNAYNNNADFNSIAGVDDGSSTPNTYKDVLKNKDQRGWWNSMKRECHVTETKGVLEIVEMSKMPPGRKGKHLHIYQKGYGK